MKTRIKIETRGNGDKVYYPEYRNWTTWPCWRSTDPFDSYGPFCTLEDAQREIDRFLKAQKRIHKAREALKVVNIEYVKYP